MLIEIKKLKQSFLNHYFYNSDKYLFFCIVLSVIFLIIAGYGSKIIKVDSCYSYNEVYMVAEFSEISIGIDHNGNVYQDNDFWEEDASKVYFIEMINSKIESKNIKEYYSDGVALPIINFPYNKSLKNKSNFDNFKLKKNSIVEKYFVDNDKIKIKLSEYNKCLTDVGNFIKVNTWYSITY